MLNVAQDHDLTTSDDPLTSVWIHCFLSNIIVSKDQSRLKQGRMCTLTFTSTEQSATTQEEDVRNYPKGENNREQQ